MYEQQDQLFAVFWVAFIAGIVFAALGAWIGSQRGHTAVGFWLGLLLGPFGLLVLVLLDRGDADAQRSDHRDLSGVEVRETHQSRERDLHRLAIQEAISRDPNLAGDSPATLAALQERAKAIELEWETKRLRDEVLKEDNAVWNGTEWVFKPEGQDATWTGDRWIITEGESQSASEPEVLGDEPARSYKADLVRSVAAFVLFLLLCAVFVMSRFSLPLAMVALPFLGLSVFFGVKAFRDWPRM